MQTGRVKESQGFELFVEETHLIVNQRSTLGLFSKEGPGQT